MTMISTSYVYDTIRTLIRKDQQGNAFNITEYNNVIQLVNIEFYNTLAAQVGEDSSNLESLKQFVTIGETIGLTNGKSALPGDYERLLGKPYWVSGSDTIPIDPISSIEKSDRLNDELTKPTTAHPIFILGDDPLASGTYGLQVYPITGISAIFIDYLSIPATPFLDYYVLSTGVYVYLDEGATSIALPSGATYRDGTVGPDTIATSQTVDFEWETHETSIIINMILQKGGLILKDESAIQYGIAKETKEEQQ